MGLPSSLTLKRVAAKRGFKLTGQLKIAGVDPKGVRIDLYGGKKAAPAPNAVSGGTGKRIASSAKLPSSGKYTLARPNVKFATFFQTRFENYTTACIGASPSGLPVPCHHERIAAVTSNQVKVLKPKPRRRSTSSLARAGPSSGGPAQRSAGRSSWRDHSCHEPG